MSDSNGDDKAVKPGIAKPAGEDEDHLEDQEKIADGRHDVNYPAVLTRDVPGG